MPAVRACLFWTGLLACVVLPGASARGAGGETFTCERQPSERWAWDPCPSAAADANELHLPLPGGHLSLVLRAVDIPGGGFWCDPQRNVILGQSGSPDPFAAVQRIQVGGGFPVEGKDRWRYFIGKYELTVGQVAAVLGNGDLRAGVSGLLRLLQSEPAAATLAKPVVEELQGYAGGEPARAWSVLGMPVRALTAPEIATVIDRFNLWCYGDAACTARLRERASLDNVPGFLRLPTEVEWEYAARGGGDALLTSSFSRETPWQTSGSGEALPSNRYAVLRSYARWPGNGPQRVGGERLSGPGGLFDMLGNVHELVAEPFGVELRQGRAGSLSARGGSRVDGDEVSFGRREEVPQYRWEPPRTPDGGAPAYRGPFRDVWLGVRLVLAGVNVPTADYMRRVREHPEGKCLSTTPAALSLSSGGAAAAALDAARRIVAPEAHGDPASAIAKLADVRKRLDDLTTADGIKQENLCLLAFAAAVNTGIAVIADFHEFNFRDAQVRNGQDLAKFGNPADAIRLDRSLQQQQTVQRLLQHRLDQYADTVREASAYERRCIDQGRDHQTESLDHIKAPTRERHVVEMVYADVGLARDHGGVLSREHFETEFEKLMNLKE